jgi:hypothetical protein
MAAHLGGKSATMIRGVAVPGVLVDGTAAYPVVGALMGTTRWLQAERIEERLLTPGHGLASLLETLAALDVDRLLREPETWELLTCCLLVDPDDDVLAVRGRRPGDQEDRTTTTRIAKGRRPIWQTGPRVAASHLITGRMPRVLRAYSWSSRGIVPACMSVTLPGGIRFNPRQRRRRVGDSFKDLSLAISEMVLRARSGALEDLDALARERLAGAGKVARNAVAYGSAVEFNDSDRSHAVWGPHGRLPGSATEEPGSLADPAVGALATAGCELMLTLLELLVSSAGGTVAFVDTDAAFVLVTETGTPIEIEGRGSDGRGVPQTAGTITFPALVEILNRFRPLAEATRLSIPSYDVIHDGNGYRLPSVQPPGSLRSVFKVTSENLVDGDLWRPGTFCYATAQKRYMLARESGERFTSPKPSAFVLGTLANFRPGGALDWDAVEDAWRIAPDLFEGIGHATPGAIDLSELVLQPMTMAAIRDWQGLGALRFSTQNPSGIRPFETVLVPVPLGEQRGRLVAHFEPDRTMWADLEFRDPRSKPWVIRTPGQLKLGTGAHGARVQIVPSLGEWLVGYFTNPEPMSLGPDGHACGGRTHGVLSPQAVRIDALRVAGQETHRRRDEESVVGWDRQEHQAEFARYCRAPGCRFVLTGRQRMWCDRHRQYPGGRRRDWMK